MVSETQKGEKPHWALVIACFTIPVVLFASVYLSTFTHGLEVEQFATREAEYRGDQTIDNSEYALYSFNIEDYSSYGCCADEERGWYPELVKTSEDVVIILNFRDQDGNIASAGSVYSGVAICPDGIDRCPGKVVDDGTEWLEMKGGLLHGVDMGYIAYEAGFLSDAELIVATDESFVPYELQIQLNKIDQPILLVLTIALTPTVAAASIMITVKMGKKDLQNTIMLKDEYEDFEADVSYSQILLSTFLKSGLYSYYLTLLMWYPVDGDWWNNPQLGPLGLILALTPPVVALRKKRSLPDGVQIRPQLWGAILSVPLCLVGLMASLFTVVGPAG